jgi:hypothetical protein
VRVAAEHLRFLEAALRGRAGGAERDA